MLANEVVDVNIISNNETGQIEIIENNKKVEKKQEFITPSDYVNNPEIINKIKLPDLKNTLKFYKNSMIIPNNSTLEISKGAEKQIMLFFFANLQHSLCHLNVVSDFLYKAYNLLPFQIELSSIRKCLFLAFKVIVSA